MGLNIVRDTCQRHAASRRQKIFNLLRDLFYRKHGVYYLTDIGTRASSFAFFVISILGCSMVDNDKVVEIVGMVGIMGIIWGR